MMDEINPDRSQKIEQTPPVHEPVTRRRKVERVDQTPPPTADKPPVDTVEISEAARQALARLYEQAENQDNEETDDTDESIDQ
ncbi:MAG: hypothetical protein PHR51_00130 [Patescibacteria group bacterium]|nr:hypothetical protein [Patescibacteria group bacterium]